VFTTEHCNENRLVNFWGGGLDLFASCAHASPYLLLLPLAPLVALLPLF
jgi:hypothetical protein